MKVRNFGPYGVNMFEVGEINTLIDIGAHTGDMALLMHEHIGFYRILALEPQKEVFEALLENSKKFDGSFDCYNVAYGCGEDLYLKYKKAKGMRRFLTEKEKEYWIPDELPEHQYPYSVESKTLEGIFQDYDVDLDKPYIIKMDCEGCERFLLENKEDLPYLKGATLFTAEFHFFKWDFDGTPKKDSTKPLEFASWIYDNFIDTHDVIIGNQRKFRLRRGDMFELVEYFSTRGLPYVSLHLQGGKGSRFLSFLPDYGVKGLRKNKWRG